MPTWTCRRSVGKRISVAKRPQLFLSSGPTTEVDAPQENDSRLVGRQHLGSFESQRNPRSESVGKNVLVVWPFELWRVVERSDFPPHRTCQLRSTVDTGVSPKTRFLGSRAPPTRLLWLRMSDSTMDGCCPNQSTFAANLVSGRRNESVGKNILVAKWSVK
jgi:hypothetical protein